MKNFTVTIGKYTLTSKAKYNDVVRANPEADENTILAQYDRRGGAIFEDGKKVPMGTFSNPQTNPQAEYVPPAKTQWKERKVGATQRKPRKKKTGK